MAANGISTLVNKSDRQIAKLKIAQAKRQGKVVADNGTISGDVDISSPYYRINNVYDLTELPTVYGPTNVDPIVDNPNLTGLLLGRPWVSDNDVLINNVELENSDDLLLENGDYILLEN